MVWRSLGNHSSSVYVEDFLKELGSVCLCGPSCSVGDADFELKRASCLCLLSAGVSLARKLDSDVRKDGRRRPQWSKYQQEGEDSLDSWSRTKLSSDYHTQKIRAVKNQSKRNLCKMTTHFYQLEGYTADNLSPGEAKRAWAS